MDTITLRKPFSLIRTKASYRYVLINPTRRDYTPSDALELMRSVSDVARGHVYKPAGPEEVRDFLAIQNRPPEFLHPFVKFNAVVVAHRHDEYDADEARGLRFWKWREEGGTEECYIPHDKEPKPPYIIVLVQLSSRFWLSDAHRAD